MRRGRCEGKGMRRVGVRGGGEGGGGGEGRRGERGGGLRECV